MTSGGGDASAGKLPGEPLDLRQRPVDVGPTRLEIFEAQAERCQRRPQLVGRVRDDSSWE